MIDVIEILTHWYAGGAQNELATSLGVDRKTLRKYTAPAVAAGMSPGGRTPMTLPPRGAGERDAERVQRFRSTNRSTPESAVAIKALTSGFCAPGRIRTCDTRFRKSLVPDRASPVTCGSLPS